MRDRKKEIERESEHVCVCVISILIMRKYLQSFDDNGDSNY